MEEIVPYGVNKKWLSPCKAIEKIIVSDVNIEYIKPSEGAKCIINMTSLNFSCDTLPQFVLSNTIYFKQDFDGRLVVGDADHEVDILLEKTVKSMCKHEASDVKLLYELLENNIKHSIIITFRLFLQDFEDMGFVFSWPMATRYYKALDHKEKGVTWYKQNNIKYAFRRFSKALKLLLSIDLDSFVDQDEKDYKLLKLSLYNNLAVCHLSHLTQPDNNWNKESAAKLAECVLSDQPHNIKALMRFGTAKRELKDFNAALNAFSTVLMEEPKNKVAQKHVEELKILIRNENKSSDDIVRKMFSNLK